MTKEANELGGAMSSQYGGHGDLVCGGIVPIFIETCRIHFENPDKLSNFDVIITPSEFSRE